MNDYEKTVHEILENMHIKIEEVIHECDSQLNKISTGKTYKDLSRALKANSPVFRGVEYRIACHSELLQRSVERQMNEVIK
ncbi:hypothetical protein HB825_05425 [Listeria booriae]|uniref:hypothetical protein n=1 Tax=Listeria booriae TaxID=1552123 RepID=UPI00164D7A98|nr:hypothetical protein [Listeria booriae]MBC6134277.1 hypothetical protein [Listeria booriae]